MNDAKKTNPIREAVGDILFVLGIFVLVSEGIKGCQRDRERNCYPHSSGYTAEEERIINDYLYEQEQFDREYGTGKQDRM